MRVPGVAVAATAIGLPPVEPESISFEYVAIVFNYTPFCNKDYPDVVSGYLTTIMPDPPSPPLFVAL